MGCCGGGSLKPVPAREPAATCGGVRVPFQASAWTILHKHAVDPCSVAGTGRDGLVTRYDVLRALGRA